MYRQRRIRAWGPSLQGIAQAGTGLGLDTAWRIVTEEHAGMFEVESAPGRTVFHVRLPIGEQAGSG